MAQNTRATIVAALKEAILEFTSDGTLIADEISTASPLDETLGLDSLDNVEVMMKMEEEFNITIDDNESKSLRTFGQAVDYLCNRLGVS